MTDKLEKEIEREPWHEEMCAKAREHRDESVFISHLGPEADSEVMIGNLRFMSFCAGYEAARLAERRELLEWIEAQRENDKSVYLNYPFECFVDALKKKLEDK